MGKIFCVWCNQCANEMNVDCLWSWLDSCNCFPLVLFDCFVLLCFILRGVECVGVIPKWICDQSCFCFLFFAFDSISKFLDIRFLLTVIVLSMCHIAVEERILCVCFILACFSLRLFYNPCCFLVGWLVFLCFAFTQRYYNLWMLLDETMFIKVAQSTIEHDSGVFVCFFLWFYLFVLKLSYFHSVFSFQNSSHLITVYLMFKNDEIGSYIDTV